jgi:predicted dehydrogenase
MDSEPAGRKVRWGVLGAARVATARVLPAMAQCRTAEVSAIASRDLAKARDAAAQFGIAKACGSYEELLADPDIEAIYIPLPNHLHTPWSIRAAEAGKHVLCEKPIALSAAEVAELIRVRDRTGVKIGEAFMVRSHPRWLRVRELVRDGRIGPLRTISGYFTIPLSDHGNVRYVAEWGGGALLDIGCYHVTLARMMFGEEPRRAIGLLDRDPQTGVDRLVSMLLDFPSGQGSFTCGFEMAWAQKMNLIGAKGRIEVDLPTTAPDSRPMRLFIDDGSDVFGEAIQVEEFPASNQYAVQADLFSKAILDNGPVPTPLEDSLHNIRAIEAVLRSGESGRWETV